MPLTTIPHISDGSPPYISFQFLLFNTSPLKSSRSIMGRGCIGSQCGPPKPWSQLKEKDYVWHKRFMLTRVETKLIWNKDIHRINIFNQYLTCKHLPDSNHDQNTTRDNRCQGKHCPAPTHCLGASYSAVSILSAWLEICKMSKCSFVTHTIHIYLKFLFKNFHYFIITTSLNWQKNLINSSPFWRKILQPDVERRYLPIKFYWSGILID